MPGGVRDANHVGTICTDSVGSMNGIFDTSPDIRNMPTASVRKTNHVGTIMNDIGTTLPGGVREMNDVGINLNVVGTVMNDVGTTYREFPKPIFTASAKETKFAHRIYTDTELICKILFCSCTV